MPLYDTEYTHALIMAMVCSLAAFLLCWLWRGENIRGNYVDSISRE